MGTLTHRGARPFRAALVLGLLAVLVAGCDLFKPAKPEIGVGGSTLLPSYAHPESCLAYMKFGIERKDAVGQDAYLGALADTTKDGAGFHAFFDLAVWNAYKAAYPDESPDFWGLSREATFLSSFFSVLLCPYQMKWLPDQDYPYDVTPDADHMLLRRRYEVRALQKPPADTLLIAVGYADLYFTRISAARWALTRWQDRVDPAVGAQPDSSEQQSFGSRRLNTR
jgi:hypothetical protein